MERGKKKKYCLFKIKKKEICEFFFNKGFFFLVMYFYFKIMNWVCIGILDVVIEIVFLVIFFVILFIL